MEVVSAIFLVMSETSVELSVLSPPKENSDLGFFGTYVSRKRLRDNSVASPEIYWIIGPSSPGIFFSE